MRALISIFGAALLAGGSPAVAEVTASSETGFVSHNEVLVAAAPMEAWAEMLRPAGWWNGEHTYSADPANMSIEQRAGGCFCEAVPGSAGVPAGQIEHMRVSYVAPSSTLRMVGGLGPLQSEAVTGVLTMTLAPDGKHTKISWDYVVGGYARMSMSDMAPLVDRVIGEQLLRLAAHLGQTWDGASRRF